MNSLSLSHLRFKHTATRAIFGWFVLCALVLQMTAFTPLVARADVLVTVTHADGSVNQHTLEQPSDDVVVSYTMGDTIDTGTPTLSALHDILASLNSALDVEKTNAEMNCIDTSSVSASASVTKDITIDGVTSLASASVKSSVACNKTGTDNTVSPRLLTVNTVFTPNPVVVPPPLLCSELNGKFGWYGQYYNYPAVHPDMELTNIALDNVSRGDPLGSTWTANWYTNSFYRFDRIDTNLQFGYLFFPFDGSKQEEILRGRDGANHDFHFGVHWSGTAHVGVPGNYPVSITSDDDSWIYVDGVLVSNNGGLHSPTTKTATLHLTGTNRIDIFWAERHTDESQFDFSFTQTGVEITPLRDDCAIPNTKPEITVVGTNPQTVVLGSPYTDLGATASDAEDGVIPVSHIVVVNPVNVNVVGSYTVTYNVVDSQGLAADQKTRVVNVVAPQKCTLPTDTILILDRSGSMNDDGTNPEQPLAKAKDAARGYIDTLSATADHVGVVSFSDMAFLNMALTGNFASAKASFSGIVAFGGTNIASAITKGMEELDANGRSNTKHVMILLSDGKPDPDTNGAGTLDAKNAATVAKTKGYTIYTIGLGNAVVPSLMTAIASAPSNYYFAPTASDLAMIYRQISETECQRVPATVAGHKYNDVNGDGQLSQGESGLSGWKITMSPTAEGMVGIRTVTTNTSGEYLFDNVSVGTYRVCEVNQSGWNQIAPVGGCYTLDVQEGINYVSKDFFNKLAPVTPPVCSLDIVSDTNTLIDNGPHAVATYSANPAWTASIPGATWIWKSFNVANPAVDDTTLFTKSFTITDPIASAVVTLAADNNFSFSMNGTLVGSDNTGINYSAVKTFDVANKLHVGANSASFTVKNIGLVGSTPTSNPAGLLYKLHVVYNKTGCDTPPPVNQRPVITLINGDMTVHINSVFTDPGATASDPEDGNITANIATSGPIVNTAVVANYTIKYNVSDSKGYAAEEKSRLVKVISACSDGVDNDDDGLVDMTDTGCKDPNDDDENTPPVIKLIGITPMSVTLGSTFIDPGANATDTEDCLGVAQTACNTKLKLTATGVVNTSVVGSYTIKYNAVDSTGAKAQEVIRTVNVTQGGSSNQPPVITLISGDMTVHINSVFVDPGANATDAEDCVGISQSACNTKLKLTATGSVHTLQVGNYTITYNATDTQSVPAQPKLRLVKVVSACSDGVDNDNDTKIDMEDTGCENPNDDSENAKPVISLIGDTVMQLLVGTAFTDPSATVLDAEDGIITHKLVATGTVFSDVVGTYTITYNATDSQSLPADQKTRTVNVYQNTPVCTVGCSGGEDNTRPVITLVGDNTISVFQNSTFTDPGATAHDFEDGDITAKIVKGGTVDMTKLGSYNISYDATDSKGLPAQQRTRTVNVVPNTSGCTVNCGGGSISLSIYNEKLEVTGTTTVTITWNTNISADSRVVYGMDSVSTLGSATYYGYPLSTVTDTTQTTAHSVVITGIPSAIASYFRPVSSNGSQTVTGIELKRTPAPIVGGQCEYLKEYMRFGINNNPIEVMKLQLFLKNFEGFTNIPTDGFFDMVTDADVRAFQDKYKADVLTPWNLPGNTGYVYYTTKKKINEIYCQREFPLDATQLTEIAGFRDLIKKLGQPTGVNAVTVLPLVGVQTTGNQGTVAGAATTQGEPKELTNTGATKTTPVSTTTVKGGRIALADLLAISPSMSGALTTATGTVFQGGVTTTEGLAKGESLVKKNFLQAAIGSISNATNISEKAVLFILFLLFVALIIAGYYGRKYMTARTNVNEMDL